MMEEEKVEERGLPEDIVRDILKRAAGTDFTDEGARYRAVSRLFDRLVRESTASVKVQDMGRTRCRLENRFRQTSDLETLLLKFPRVASVLLWNVRGLTSSPVIASEFLVELRIVNLAHLESVDALRGNRTLKRLELSDLPLLANIEPLEELPALEELDLNTLGACGAWSASLASCAACLKTLRIFNMPVAAEEMVEYPPEKASRLESLEILLPGLELEKKSLPDAPPALNLVLTSVAKSSFTISHVSLHHSALVSLDVSHNLSVRDVDALLGHQALRFLYLDHTRVSRIPLHPTDLVAAERAAAWPSLEVLSAAKCEFVSIADVALGRVEMPHLRTLVLEDNVRLAYDEEMSAADRASLSRFVMAKAPHLEFLDLRGCIKLSRSDVIMDHIMTRATYEVALDGCRIPRIDRLTPRHVAELYFTF